MKNTNKIVISETSSLDKNIKTIDKNINNRKIVDNVLSCGSFEIRFCNKRVFLKEKSK